MTATPTHPATTAPAAGVGAYDAARRADATRRRAATPRMGGRIIPVSPAHNPTGGDTTFVWQHGRRLVHATGADLTRPAAVTAAALPGIAAAAFQTPGGTLVVPDRTTLTRLIRVAEQAGRASASLARQLRALSRAANSGRLVVLTRGLGRAHYLPDGDDPDQFEQWTRRLRFGAGPQAMLAALRHLTDATRDGAAAGRLAAKMFDEFAGTETEAVRALQFGGDAAAHQAFAYLTRMADTWNTIERINPALRARNIVAGDVVRAAPTAGPQSDGVVCTLTTPVYLSEGDIVLVGADDETGFSVDARAKLTRISMDDRGGMVGLLSRPRGPNATTFSVVEAAAKKRSSVLLTKQAAFTGRAGTGSARRWIPTADADTTRSGSGGLPRRPHRDVPIAVSLAGAPVGP